MSLQVLEKSVMQLDEQASAQNSFPAWLHTHREQQRAAFMRHGIPQQKHERWKYTDLGILDKQHFILSDENHGVTQESIDACRLQDTESVLLVFIDGRFAPQYSELHKLPSAVIACSMLTALAEHEALVKPHLLNDMCAEDYPFAALSAALFADGLFLVIPEQMKLTAPLHLLSVSSGQHAVITHARNVLLFGKDSEANIVHEYAGLRDDIYFTNVLTTISAQPGAKLNLLKLQHESVQAVHMEKVVVQQAKDSDVTLMHVTTGAHFSRDDTAGSLAEAGAVCRAIGFYQTSRNGQYVDHHVAIKHVAPRTSSEMLYKGIADKKSRLVFNGGLYVAKDAQKINAFQENHTLLLSGQAEVYAKPELEIYADDVKCRHGATTGQIDQDALFYMRARGMDKLTAVHILLKGFAEDVLQRITHPAIRQHAIKQVTFL